MPIKVGTDIMDIERFRQVLERRPRLKDKIFTVGEVAYCEAKADPAPHFAARFCAKEAFAKALGTGVSKFSMFEVEVVNTKQGKPELELYGRARTAAVGAWVRDLDLSISHSNFAAIAVVVLETGEN